MPHPITGFPIPQDRTANNPCVLLEKSQVLYWYTVFAHLPDDTLWNDTETMAVVIEAAKKLGWSQVFSSGKQLLLIADVSVES